MSGACAIGYVQRERRPATEGPQVEFGLIAFLGVFYLYIAFLISSRLFCSAADGVAKLPAQRLQVSAAGTGAALSYKFDDAACSL